MTTVGDAKLIELNKEQFIGKPLKVLLKEIKPKIKMASADASEDPSTPGHFVFRFVDKKRYDSIRITERTYPLQIEVFVKESFEWNARDKAATDFAWTKHDAEAYGSLTVADIRVFGKY